MFMAITYSTDRTDLDFATPAVLGVDIMRYKAAEAVCRELAQETVLEDGREAVCTFVFTNGFTDETASLFPDNHPNCEPLSCTLERITDLVKSVRDSFTLLVDRGDGTENVYAVVEV